MRIAAYALSDISVGGARIGKICQAAVGRACKVFLSSTGGWGGQDASVGNDAARGMAEVTSRRRHQAGLPSSRVNRVISQDGKQPAISCIVTKGPVQRRPPLWSAYTLQHLVFEPRGGRAICLALLRDPSSPLSGGCRERYDMLSSS